MVWQVLLEQGSKFLNRQAVQGVQLVDDGFEVVQLGEAVKDVGELLARNSTVVEEDTVHHFVVEELASYCQALTVSFIK